MIQAYLALFVVPAGVDGSRMVSLARFGCYDVRLFELPSHALADALPLWMELYDHDRGATLDSCGCDEVEAAVAAAHDFMAQARRLDEQRRGARILAGSGRPILVTGASRPRSA